jgi:hypothetical protein
MAAAGPWVIYNEFKESLGKKTLDLVNDTFKVALFSSTSNAGSATLATAQYATLTNQTASGNGYTTTGTSVTPAWTRSTGTVTFDTSDATWTASGGTITARFAVLYDDTAASKNLVAYCLLDSAPADIVISDTNSLTLSIVNVFTLA